MVRLCWEWRERRKRIKNEEGGRNDNMRGLKNSNHKNEKAVKFVIESVKTLTNSHRKERQDPTENNWER